MKKRVLFPLLLALSVSLCSGFATSPLFGASPGALRPGNWAMPVEGTTVSNFYRVEPDLYRSAQPTSAGFKELEALGVKTVLDLTGGDGDREAIRGTSVRLLRVPMTAWGLRDDRVLEALRILSDSKNRPLLIHCKHGADRTGAIMALYRVVVQGWSKQDAVREMNEGGYHHSSLWSNLDRYVLAADVAAFRSRVDLITPVTSPTILTAETANATAPAAMPSGAALQSRTSTTVAPAQASSNQ